LEVIDTKFKEKSYLEVYVDDGYGNYYCYRYEPSIRSRKLEFLSRHKYNPESKVRIYNLRRGLIGDKDLQIAKDLLNENRVRLCMVYF
jgi:hypothetical protein